MKICMFTNTYLPHVGGVARSVASSTEDLIKMGHDVMVVAPTFPDSTPEIDARHQVLRVPALQNFNGSDFSVRLPLPFTINKEVQNFGPEILHSHHPYLMGDSALRLARQYDLPLVFTHHTLYERYTHYVPFDSKTMKRFVIHLSTEYANMCSSVVAPSDSVAGMLRERGVTVPVEVIPTGVDIDFFAGGQKEKLRKSLGIGPDIKVIGHLGRLAREKNLDYLSEAVVHYLKEDQNAVFLVAGLGPYQEDMQKIFEQSGLADRFIPAGKMTGQDLADAYKAMDLFVFSSQSETQGMVIAEAMAAGRAVIALDASGAREIVEDNENGRLLDAESSPSEFAQAIKEFFQDGEKRKNWEKKAIDTAKLFSRETCSRRLTGLYENVLATFVREHGQTYEKLIFWDSLLRGIKAQWQVLSRKTSAAASVLKAKDEGLDQ